MAKYIFATKFKKIEKEPLYYNMQISVDKDCLASEVGIVPPVLPGDEPVDFHFYKDSPIILSFIFENYWGTGKYMGGLEIKNEGGDTTRLFLDEVSIFSICEGYYPLPEIVSVVKNGVTFTFTPIPVYEPESKPLYYNIQMSVDRTCTAADIINMDPDWHNIIFYEHSPIILTFVSENYWNYSSEDFTMDIVKPVTYTNLVLNTTPLIFICEGTYPLPETVSIVKNGITVTFTPIPVYE
jgi:hypothetical protein